MRFKICCISSIEEAILAKNSGAFALGLVGEMPSGPGVITDALIFEIAMHSLIKNNIETFLLTSNTTAESIIAHHCRCQTSCIQIVDAVENTELEKIRKALPTIKLIQVMHVINELSITEAIAKENYIDYLLLDSGNPNAAIKTLGGTGNTHNWEISKQIVQQSKVPVFLAGGLNATNTAMAINKVQPFGLDICSGVRSNGKLDEEKLQSFVNASL